MKVLRKIAREITLRWRKPTRYILERKIFPKIKNQNVLLVGVASYTEDYPKKLNDNEVYTIDILPEVAKFGSDNHVIGSVTEVDKYFEKELFDTVILYGVFGKKGGLDSLEDAEKTLLSIHKVLKKEGLLIIVWKNIPFHNEIEPLKLINSKLYKPSKKFGFPSRFIMGQGINSVYDFFTKNESYLAQEEWK